MQSIKRRWTKGLVPQDIIRKKVLELVRHYSIVTWKADLLLQYYILRVVEKKETGLPINQTLFTQLIRLVQGCFNPRSTSQEIQFLQLCAQEMPPFVDSRVNVQYMGQLERLLATQMNTNFQLYLERIDTTYTQQTLRYLDKVNARKWHSWLWKDLQELEETSECTREEASTLHEFLNHGFGKKGCWEKLQYAHWLLSMRTPDEKKFFLCPQRSISLQHLPFDFTATQNLLHSCNWEIYSVSFEDPEKRKEEVDRVFGIMFSSQVHALEHGPWKFDFSFQTDGYACTLIHTTRDPYRKKGIAARQGTKRKHSEEEDPSPVDLLAFDRFVGLDPGRAKLFTAVVCEGPLNEEVFTTQMPSLCESMKHFVKRRQKMNHSSGKPSDTPMESLKVCSSRLFLDALRSNISSWTTQWNQLTQKTSQQKFRAYRTKQKHLEEMGRILCPQKSQKTLLAFGDAHFAWGGKSGVAPVQGLRKFLSKQKYCHVVPIDEFRSSKLCSVCYSELQGDLFQVRHCSRCPSGALRYWNRDINAARNILHRLLWKEEVPPAFQRSSRSPGVG